MDRFDETWIPDNAIAPLLAGELSRPFTQTSKQVYIGPLSRFDACAEPNQKHILIVLSGPEPQRSILEKTILNNCDAIEATIVLVRGSDAAISLDTRTRLVVHDFADTTLLNKLICDASIIVSRSGYTSLMDILKLKKRWIAVATPGQAEQEYLADYLHRNRWAMSVHQSEFNLSTALNDAAAFKFEHPSINTEKYKETIARILSF
jgi:UDP-N-acetylglucosamine transferase subunit ALG13